MNLRRWVQDGCVHDMLEYVNSEIKLWIFWWSYDTAVLSLLLQKKIIRI